MNSSPIILVIFGATGDLMQRKLVPAMYRLLKRKDIGRIHLVAVGRRSLSKSDFCTFLYDALKKNVLQIDEILWKQIEEDISYIEGHFEDEKTYAAIKILVAKADDAYKACVPRYFYLATPPVHYETILKKLAESGLSEGCVTSNIQQKRGENIGINSTKILIEKPFGNDLSTARSLEKLLSSIFQEQQIYRIDHYLGKETVQNILALRFANGIFDPTWNSEFIDHVQIALAESDGVGDRGAFYDGVGALRDVVQNHMFEMLAVTAMEQPHAFTADSIRDARIEVLKHILPVDDAMGQTVRGQYQGYLLEKQIARDSKTETFFAGKFLVDTPRWNGVPFYLRTGKKLKTKVTEISLHYKKPVCTGDVCFFRPDDVMRNVLSLRIQPDEGITLRLMVKEPGFGMRVTPTKMEFCYAQAFGSTVSPEPYERLLLDALRGDQTLFARTDGIDASWSLVTGILNAWEFSNQSLCSYKGGTWGPKESDDFIQKDGRAWFLGSEA
ncbi:glucose-6-phosphate dehydrogenase [Candidatus Gottesmanbacteria bacterium]|nr:glucose-6-phosphate dehydrogenase [Candidatus Gottesmanbacteria bacterium]